MAGRRTTTPGRPDQLTIKELLARFWTHAEQYYRTVTDGRVKELEQFRLALRPLKELYADTPTADFGPRALKAIQSEDDRRWAGAGPTSTSSSTASATCSSGPSATRLFPARCSMPSRPCPGSERGRSDAYEPEAVKPVPMEMVEAIQPFVSRQVWAMIQLQLFTAARAGEIAQMRPCDIDRQGQDLPTGSEGLGLPPRAAQDRLARPQAEDLHRPRGQEVLGAVPAVATRRPTASRPPRRRADRRRRLHEKRTTPLAYGNVPGSNVKDDPERSAGDRYTTDSYRRAIARACDQAFPPPEPLAKREDETDDEWQTRLTAEQKTELDAWQKAHRWHPHQLRHNAATELRKEFGIEAARIILGHHSAAVTEIYAEKDEQQAVEAMARVG